MSHRVLSIVIIALCGTAAFAQTPTFRLQVEYVEVDARVTDSKGNFVRDLTKEDFQILEDGKPRPLAAFSLVDIPTTRPSLRRFRLSRTCRVTSAASTAAST